MRVLERNASDGVNPIILIQFGSLYLTRLISKADPYSGAHGARLPVQKNSGDRRESDYAVSEDA